MALRHRWKLIVLIVLVAELLRRRRKARRNLLRGSRREDFARLILTLCIPRLGASAALPIPDLTAEVQWGGADEADAASTAALASTTTPTPVAAAAAASIATAQTVAGTAALSSRLTLADCALPVGAALAIAFAYGHACGACALSLGVCVLSLATAILAARLAELIGAHRQPGQPGRRPAAWRAAPPPLSPDALGASPGQPPEPLAGSLAEDPLVSLAVSTGREAVCLFERVVGAPAKAGFSAHSVCSGVSIWTKTERPGLTHCIGEGEVRAPPGVVLHVQGRYERRLDSLHASTEVLRSLPAAALELAGWEAKLLELVRLRWVAKWPVGPRELLGVRVVMRRTRDGAIRAVLRSCDAAERHGLPPPGEGRTRVDLFVGGFEATPRPEPAGRDQSEANACHVVYLNMVDARLPSLLPGAVSKALAPQRAMVVDRIRRIAEDPAIWNDAPEWTRM